jgi:hypothetical protein
VHSQSARELVTDLFNRQAADKNFAIGLLRVRVSRVLAVI